MQLSFPPDEEIFVIPWKVSTKVGEFELMKKTAVRTWKLEALELEQSYYETSAAAALFGGSLQEVSFKAF